MGGEVQRMAEPTWYVTDLEHLTAIVHDLVGCGFNDFEKKQLLAHEIRVEHERIARRIEKLMNDRERMKFWSARRCWKERAQKTPSGEETWGEWFERLYGESLEAYAVRAARDGITQKVMEYELATFGFSPLEKEKAA